MSKAAAKKDFMTTYMRPPPPSQTWINDGSVALWLVDINAAERALWTIERKTPRLSWRERMDFETASNWSRARIRFCAHVALRLVLERWLGAHAVRGVAFEFDKSGKPYLRGSGLDFSLSYADSMVLIGIRTGGAIGVDLESERDVRMSAPRRAGIVAAANALSTQSLLPHEGKSRGAAGGMTSFLQAWTRLEAVSKATGMGIGRVLGHFGLIGPDKARRKADLDAVTDFIDCYSLGVRDLEVFPGLYASVAQICGTVMPDVQQLPVELDALDDFVADTRQRR